MIPIDLVLVGACGYCAEHSPTDVPIELMAVANLSSPLTGRSEI